MDNSPKQQYLENSRVIGPKHRYPENPKIIGPFRGVILRFNKEMDTEEIEKTLLEITLKHPNYHHSKGDAHKHIIYYKYPYDAAIVLEKYSHNTNFGISIHMDKLSRPLVSTILYIESKSTQQLIKSIASLKGKIIFRQLKGIQVQFENFKQTCIDRKTCKR